MTITAKYPASLATMTDYTDTGVGREKSNDKDPRHLTKNIIGPEYSQLCGELIATQKHVGTTLSEPTSYGDDCLDSHQETLEWMAMRSDRAGFCEHWLQDAYSTRWLQDIGAVGAFAHVGGAGGDCGVVNITCAAGVATGYDQTYDHFRQRYTYMRVRWQIDVLLGGGADTMEIGLIRTGGGFVKFHVTAPSVPNPWTVEIDDSVNPPDSQAMGTLPDPGTWHVHEILTTVSGAHFWIDRGTAQEEHIYLSGAIPENNYCHPAVYVTQAAGGAVQSFDMMACRDTRPL